jgi:2-polyprenyl-6-methoxyphenol hydroxylase-like FAD-dependent oxidoreductase
MLLADHNAQAFAAMPAHEADGRSCLRSVNPGAPRIVVVGGGVGGLTTAIALRSVGIEARVLERAPELREVGAGIGLWPNAIHVLERLGLGAEVRALGGGRLGGAVVTHQGRRLSDQPAAVLEARWGAPTIAVLRSDLQALLRAALPEEAIVLGVEVTGLDVGSDQVELSFAGGDRTTADLVVGADGLRSVVRAQMLGDGPPRYRGYTAWRGVAAVGSGRGLDGASELWGPGARFGVLPTRDARAVWYASANVPEGGRGGRGEHEEVLERFGSWPDPIPAVLAATPPDAVVRNDVYDRSITRRWVSHRVALVGDAAHPMTPDLGQGACQAIVDAWVLADAVRRGDDSLEGALQEYERIRWRTAAVATVLARTLGRVGQWEHPLACRLRAEVMHATPLAVQLWPLDAVLRVPPAHPGVMGPPGRGPAGWRRSLRRVAAMRRSI